MIAITVTSARPYQNDVCAWLRQHHIEPDDCQTVLIFERLHLVLAHVLRRNARGAHYMQDQHDLASKIVWRVLRRSPRSTWADFRRPLL